MPRKPRLFVSEATYHVYSRVARGEFAFDDPYEAEEFVETVQHVGDLHNWRVLAWCLMGNHYHLVVNNMGAWYGGCDRFREPGEDATIWPRARTTLAPPFSTSVEDWHAVQGDRDRASRFEAEPPAGIRCNRAGLRQGPRLGRLPRRGHHRCGWTLQRHLQLGRLPGPSHRLRGDIFVKVTNPASGKTTKSKVFEELTGSLTKNDAEEIMNLGDVEVD